jgi:hypothetical protein
MDKLDPQPYRELAMSMWLKDLGPYSKTASETAWIAFKRMMPELDPVDLLWEARRTQDTQRIQSVMIRFYDRCLARGLEESTSWEYTKRMRLFFTRNRIPLPLRLKRKPVPTVPLQLLDAA